MCPDFPLRGPADGQQMEENTREADSTCRLHFLRSRSSEIRFVSFFFIQNFLFRIFILFLRKKIGCGFLVQNWPGKVESEEYGLQNAIRWGVVQGSGEIFLDHKNISF